MIESKQLLRDVNLKPSEDIISNGLGTTNSIYIKFINKLKKYDVSLMEWRYYNDGKAWLSKGEYKWITSRGTNKTKPIFWLSIWEGYFKVSFFFSEKTKNTLLNLAISKETKELIEHIKPNGDKKKFLSIIFDVKDENQLNDIFELIQFRKENI